jgi:hypothetical protein
MKESMKGGKGTLSWAGNYGLGLEMKKQKYPEASKGMSANSMPRADFFMLQCGKHDAPFTIGTTKTPNRAGIKRVCANAASGLMPVYFAFDRASPVDFKIIQDAFQDPVRERLPGKASISKEQKAVIYGLANVRRRFLEAMPCRNVQKSVGRIQKGRQT